MVANPLGTCKFIKADKFRQIAFHPVISLHNVFETSANQTPPNGAASAARIVASFSRSGESKLSINLHSKSGSAASLFLRDKSC